ncbi:MAG TPA: nucleotidyl transferase AbiEii/AbiGii toxin family protein [Thermomicrobiaceae bacterium]|nr:nucleotidyl transferase AbiEii/AbiGii toxin family protein [Thermomicrobiaceae bacterium]
MRYATATAFRSSLERRLLNQAQAKGVSLVRLRKLVVFDRLLARLLIAAPDRWLLKGALALDFRLGVRSRATKDLDLARPDNEAAATADFLAAQEVDLGDYFIFAIEKSGGLNPDLEAATPRYHVTAELAGRLFEDVIVDVGFGDPFPESAEILRGPELLRFAEIDPVEVPALPIEQHVAEKVHAYTRSYAGQHPSTRVKDLIDLVLIQSQMPIAAPVLRSALRSTFEARATHTLPRTLPPPPPERNIAYRRLATATRLDPSLSSGYAAAANFLDPILDGSAIAAARWSPARGSWELINPDTRSPGR